MNKQFLETQRTMRGQRGVAGFTLVELAVVMVIIGLLIGGILKGQELIENAKMSSTVAQFKAIEAAYNGFVDKFNAQPGDLLAPNTSIAGCAAASTAGMACNPNLFDIDGTAASGVTGSLGNGRIDKVVGLENITGDEATAFFVQLSVSGFLSGYAANPVQTAAAEQGFTHPTAPIGGGYIMGDQRADNETTARVAGFSRSTATADFGLRSRPYVVLKRDVSTVAANSGSVSGLQAATMDGRIDDGKPFSGGMVSDTITPGCYLATAASTAPLTTAPSAALTTQAGISSAVYFRSSGAGVSCTVAYRL